MKKLPPFIILGFIALSMISFLNLSTINVSPSQNVLKKDKSILAINSIVDMNDEHFDFSPRQLREDHAIKNYVWRTQRTYPELMNICRDYEGYSLIDIEISKVGQTVYFDFILHYTGSTLSNFKRCKIIQDVTPREMRERLRESELRIVDLEVRTPINDPRLYAIVRSKETNSRYEFRINVSASQVRQYKIDNPNERIIDIEFNSQNNANNYHFVSIPNTDNLEWDLYLSHHKARMNSLMKNKGHRPIDIEHGSDNNVITSITIKDNSYWAYRTEIPKSTINHQIKTRDMKVIDLEQNSDGSYSLIMVNNIPDRLHPKHNEAMSFIQEVIDAGAVGLTVSIIKDKKIIYNIGSGYSDKNLGYPMSPYVTTQRWASLSKSTGGALASLFHQLGYINIRTDLISEYTNYTLYNNAEISNPSKVPTFIQLFSHEAGIQHYNDGPLDMVPPKSDINSTSNTSMRWAVDYWINQMTSLPSLGTYNYSTFGPNLGCVGLEDAYKQATGTTETFPNLFKRLLARPVGAYKIDPDYYYFNDAYKTNAYLLDGSLDPDGDDDVSYKLCGGGLKSTIHNYAKHLSIYWRGEENPLNTLARHRIFKDYTSDNSNNYYGLGWVIWTDNRATHTGVQPGARNEVWIKHNVGNAVVIMSNTSDLDSTIISQLRNDMISLFELD